MRKLIISLKTYDFIPHTAGMVITEKENDFELLRIFGDQYNSIFWARNLCHSAIFEQRRHDLKMISNSIGIKKLSSFNYNETLFDDKQMKSMVTKLKLISMFNMIKEIYIPDNLLFINIFKNLFNEDVKIYLYGSGDKEVKKVVLSQEYYREKLELRKLMVGIHKKEDLDLYKPIERFYNI